MSVMGENIQNFDIPVCNKFRPAVVDGQLCYQVDINQFKDQVDSEKLMSHGLMMMMDYNEDRMGLDTSLDFDTSLGQDLGDMDGADDKKNEAKIYIETLGMIYYEITIFRII